MTGQRNFLKENQDLKQQYNTADDLR